MKPSTDLTGEVDYGNIDYFFSEDNHYTVGGDFDLKITTNKEPVLVFEQNN